jgi:hypothetical protein
MLSIEITGVDAADKVLEEYPRGAQRVIVRALNRGIASANTFMAGAVARDMKMKVGDVKAAFSLRKASFDRPEALLAAPTKRIPLIAFGARGTRRGGVTAAGKRYPHAFLATMPGGHTGVFMRVAGANRRGPKPNRSQLPIKQLYGPSIGHVFAKFRAQGLARAEEMFQKTLDHELERAEARNATGTD